VSDDFDIAWMTDKTAELIFAAVAGDGGRCADLLADVGERYGARGGYTLCCALSTAIAEMGEYKSDQPGFWGFEVAHVDRGLLAPEDVDPDSRDVVYAMRFVIAHLNGDVEQKLALFHAFETPEEHLALPIGLIKMVGAHGRHKLEEARDAAPH